VSALLLGGACLASAPGTALADNTAEDLSQLWAAIQKELADLKKREQKRTYRFIHCRERGVGEFWDTRDTPTRACWANVSWSVRGNGHHRKRNKTPVG